MHAQNQKIEIGAASMLGDALVTSFLHVLVQIQHLLPVAGVVY